MCTGDTPDRARRFGRDHDFDSTVSPWTATAAASCSPAAGAAGSASTRRRSCSTARRSPQRAARRLGAVCEPVVEAGDGVSGAARRSASSPSGAARWRRWPPPAAGCATAGHHGTGAPPRRRPARRSTSAFLRGCATARANPPTVLRVDGRLQPVCAALRAPTRCSRPQSLVAGGVRALHELFDVVEHDVVEPDEWRIVADADTFLDVDTPDRRPAVRNHPSGVSVKW